MQPARPAANPTPVRIYNAVYSSVQVYECMIRGIAVMRRRGDSYVNATQILKVAGIDKGRRTKILEKEILPGKHEIVQGGYGKYQGTWIPLDRGRDIASQYGVLPLLASLFDFTPSTNSLSALPMSAPPNLTGVTPRPLSASSSYGSLTGNYLPGVLAPPPIMPGSALRLLNQGRAQGLFTPSTSAAHGSSRFTQVSPIPGQSQSPFSPASATPPPFNTLKRPRSDPESVTIAPQVDVHMSDGTRPLSTGTQINGTAASDEGPSPAKRPRKESAPPDLTSSFTPATTVSAMSNTTTTRPPSASSGGAPPATPTTVAEREHMPRFATKPTYPRNLDLSAPLKDTRRAAVIASIYQGDDPVAVLNLLREIASFPANGIHGGITPTPSNNGRTIDVDTILDEQGHNALHLASSLTRVTTVQALLSHGADVHRGNHLGETPLMRTILSTHSYSAQSLPILLQTGLHQSVLTVDTSRKSVLHHIVSLAGVKGRAVVARYYLDQIFYWIAKEMMGDFGCIVDLQDEHGDTALNIAARVGSRTLVRTLVDVGANKTLSNKLGLRPGDFGVETEELSVGQKAEDIVQMLRPAAPAPVQKSQDVIADMTAMVQSLATEFQAEIKVKQDALDVTQAHLRAATRELSEQRKQIQSWQSRCSELDLVAQRVKNLEKAIEEEDTWDWTGRSKLKEDNQPEEEDKPKEESRPSRLVEEDTDADASADDDDEAMALDASTHAITALATSTSPAFRYRGVGMSGSSEPSNITQIPVMAADPDPPMPIGNDVETLIKLRRMKMWHVRLEALMEERLKHLRGMSAEKEHMCRRIVALCTGMAVDKVEDMLDNLVIAMESEANIVDIGRVSGFMQKVRDGIL
ncbi:transcription factor [Lentinula aciculospora]|uniref:Transcription factor n=1 Tax=Lentinula aciculospora TaxID=153920 RepID=A0A9W9DGK8_9AGAR|nr:transcription factor [Lentinula aciculospora]